MTLLAQVRRWRPSILRRHFHDGAHKARTRVEVDQWDVLRNVVLHERNLLIARDEPVDREERLHHIEEREKKKKVYHLEEIGTNHRELRDVPMTSVRRPSGTVLRHPNLPTGTGSAFQKFSRLLELSPRCNFTRFVTWTSRRREFHGQ